MFFFFNILYPHKPISLPKKTLKEPFYAKFNPPRCNSILNQYDARVISKLISVLYTAFYLDIMVPMNGTAW